MFIKLNRSQSGQTMVFMVVVLTILCLILIWHFDFHKILFVKTVAQNAGDAAALNAARWQGQSLNMIGDLNIMKAIALTQAGPDIEETLAQIDDMQARLCYVGPLLALLGAQQAAKNNGIFNNDSFTDRLREHAESVLSDYPEIFVEPYDNCWEEYADMLQSIADQGIAVGPDNAAYYTDYTGGHILLRLDFYDAVAGREWCWFWRYDLSLLENYTDFRYWPDLPPMETQDTSPVNSEIFGLGLVSHSTSLPGGETVVDLMNTIAAERALSSETITNDTSVLTCSWYRYAPAQWAAWESMSRSGSDPFPVLGDVKPQYDYTGADAATRVVAEATRVSPGKQGGVITWTAAAKPFGYLESSETPEEPVRPNAYSIVLPAFREVRLIPLDASSAPAGGTYDLAWRDHIENHLPLYLENGIAGLDEDCWYCRQLIKWEDPEFRIQGVNWLNETDEHGELLHNCNRPTGPGGPDGSARRGH